MKVHIVCHDYRSPGRSILARLGRALAGNTGWTISGQPRPDVDLNYFFPYIMWADRFPQFRDTLIACYFTHRETGNWKVKQQWFDWAAEHCDLRFTSSRVYLHHLERHGPTALVSRPPVDRSMFRSKPRDSDNAMANQPVVGLSGFVDKRSGRKGEDLVEQLAQEGLDCTFTAIGRGWPVSTRMISFEDIPDFYNSIDVYLCSAWLEGIPMTILEALACGTKVVVPEGVGIVDDLPDTRGIVRYRAGDYSDILRATKEALKVEADREGLRAVTRQYNLNNWGFDHQLAVEEFFSPPETDVLPDWPGHSGMYVVGFGDPSRECARVCVDSFKRWMPGIPVAFSGTTPLGGEDYFVEREDIDIGGRLAKLAVYDSVPDDWTYVLYLDADTEVTDDISFLFKVLADGWEAVICRDMGKYQTARMMLRPDNSTETDETLRTLGCPEVMQYNGGVFGFRRTENVQRFFELWNSEWQKYGGRDQGALLRALYKNPLRLMVLNNQWNASDRYEMPTGKVAIVHHNMCARRWGGLIDGRLDSDKAWREVAKWEATHRR